MRNRFLLLSFLLMISAGAFSGANEIIGKWTVGGEAPHTKILRRQNDILVLEERFGDGSSQTLAVESRSVESGARIDFLESRSDGNYYIINNAGDLEDWDSEGLIRTYKRVGNQSVRSAKIMRLSQKETAEARSKRGTRTFLHGTDDGYAWNKATRETKLAICESLAKKQGEIQTPEFYFEALEAFYNSDNTSVLSMRIAQAAAMAAVASKGND